MLSRDAAVWSKVRQRKVEHWAREHHRHDPAMALQAAEALRAHVVALRPGWPDAQTRRKDWENHARMRSLFDKMAHGLNEKPRRKVTRLQRALTIKLGSRSVRFAAPEDLIAMKVLSARPKDLEDVESILAAKRNELDTSLIHETLKTAEGMLDQSDLLRTFQQLLKASASAGTHRTPFGNELQKQRARKVTTSKKTRKKRPSTTRKK